MKGNLDRKTDSSKSSTQLNSAGFDPWGLDRSTVARFAKNFSWLYHKYFRVTVSGIENIPKGGGILVANHGGQFPIDGLLIILSVYYYGQPQRVVRGLVDRWVPSLPFFSTIFSRCGQMIGSPKNAESLLNQDQLLLVFPEGSRGSGKSIFEKYRLKEFGQGFIRLAMKTDSPIIPVSVVGTEECYPAIYHSDFLAKLLKLPYFPITPFFPILGPLGLLPLPCKISIKFGKPIHLEGDLDTQSQDDVLRSVDKVRKAVASQIRQDLKKRKGRLFT